LSWTHRDELCARGDPELVEDVGKVMRPDTFRRYAAEAGFRHVEILDQVEHDFLRFYRLTP